MAAKQLTSWSFSRYSDYKQCPARAKYKHLDRLPEPKSEALARGTAVHTKAEHYLDRGQARLPVELKLFANLFKHLRKVKKKNPPLVQVEQSWAFKKDWSTTRWDDWGGCAVRLKVDCYEINEERIYIYDWKTGKFRAEKNADYLEQVSLYALGALLLYPGSVVVPRLVYLDTGEQYPSTEVEYHQEDIVKLKQEWSDRVSPMLNDTVFAPTPSHSCRWCTFRKEAGGPCAF